MATGIYLHTFHVIFGNDDDWCLQIKLFSVIHLIPIIDSMENDNFGFRLLLLQLSSSSAVVDGT